MIKRYVLLMATMVAATLGAGCDAWLTKPSRYNTVQALVSQPNGSPIPGASLVLYTGQRPMGYGTTDSSGRFTFVRVPQGNYGVTVTRPLLFHDFVVANDSPYSTKDNIVVDAGSQASLTFTLSRCAGTVVAKIVDQTGAPVAVVTAVLYTSLQELELDRSGANGTITFTGVPCAYELGVRINPPFGYTVGQGRGFNVLDGFRVTNGGTTNVLFVVHKN